MSRYVGSKWRKTVAILKHAAVSKHVPETLRMTKTSLLNSLNKHGMVYVKPEFGSYGNGVMRVEQLKNGYQYQFEEKIRHFNHFAPMYQSIVKLTGSKRYLVQKGIHLLEHDRP